MSFCCGHLVHLSLLLLLLILLCMFCEHCTAASFCHHLLLLTDFCSVICFFPVPSRLFCQIPQSASATAPPHRSAGHRLSVPTGYTILYIMYMDAIRILQKVICLKSSFDKKTSRSPKGTVGYLVPVTGLDLHFRPLHCTNNIDGCPQAFRPLSSIYGLSPGLKKCPPDTFLPCLTARPPSSSPPPKSKKTAIQRMTVFFGAGDRTRTGTLSPAVDFESTTSTIPSHRQVLIQYNPLFQK